MPTVPEALKVALQHFQAGRLSQAEQLYRQILQQQPEQPEVLQRLGDIAQKTGQTDAAIAYHTKASELYYRIGNTLLVQRQLEAAIAHYQQSVALNPKQPDVYNNLGNAYQNCGQNEAAIAAYRQAIAINPSFAAAHTNLGNIFKHQGQAAEAITHYRQAIALQPDLAEAYNNLGNVLKDHGQVPEAIAVYRQALTIKPSLLEAASNLLFSLHYTPTYDSAAIFAEHQQWAKQYAAPLAHTIAPHSNDRTRDRRLRIGYVSPDFNSHPVGFFIGSVLFAHNRNQFQVFCYANVASPDGLTAQLQRLADDWRDIASLSDEQAAHQIRADKIDILVDLAGHTANNRILLFARKPAPIQVTYLGYPNTTGLSTIDYRISDTWADPVDIADKLHTEKLVRLPHGFHCYQPAQNCPTVSPLPALLTGQVTFGSFNNLAKVTPEAIAVWARILQAVPQSKILLKYRALTDASTCEHCYQLFEQHQILRDRVQLIGHITGFAEHLALYSQIDIGLDTFPYNGTTTTCEALWMGVPVITVAGKGHAARVGVSLLANLGLTDLITSSCDEYVDLAVRLANDLERLRYLRTHLRSIMMRSPLTNARSFTQSLEMAYRQMWYRWCTSA